MSRKITRNPPQTCRAHYRHPPIWIRFRTSSIFYAAINIKYCITRRTTRMRALILESFPAEGYILPGMTSFPVTPAEGTLRDYIQEFDTVAAELDSKIETISVPLPRQNYIGMTSCATHYNPHWQSFRTNSALVTSTGCILRRGGRGCDTLLHVHPAVKVLALGQSMSSGTEHCLFQSCLL